MKTKTVIIRHQFEAEVVLQAPVDENGNVDEVFVAIMGSVDTPVGMTHLGTTVTDDTTLQELMKLCGD